MKYMRYEPLKVGQLIDPNEHFPPFPESLELKHYEFLTSDTEINNLLRDIGDEYRTMCKRGFKPGLVLVADWVFKKLLGNRLASASTGVTFQGLQVVPIPSDDLYIYIIPQTAESALDDFLSRCDQC